jgi:hypothetical protein
MGAPIFVKIEGGRGISWATWHGMTPDLKTLLNPRTTRGGGLMQPPLRFFRDSFWTARRIGMRFGTAYGATFAHISVKKNLTGSGQVTELWRHKRYSLRPTFQWNRVLPQIDETLLIQMQTFDVVWVRTMSDMTVHTTVWPRKVIWGHWPRMTSHIPKITFLVLFTVFLSGGFEYDDYFCMNVIDTDPPMTCVRNDTKTWRHRFDLWNVTSSGW